MTDFDKINKELYDLLKDKLKLHERCNMFSLTVEFGDIPKVTECYYVYPEFKKVEENRKLDA